jgi:hypothetical protein
MCIEKDMVYRTAALAVAVAVAVAVVMWSGCGVVVEWM